MIQVDSKGQERLEVLIASHVKVSPGSKYSNIYKMLEMQR